jgi:glycosyltransferase involved in cell wall biosynthesis
LSKSPVRFEPVAKAISPVAETGGWAMKHFISIVIPNYNGSRTIGKCLESIFAFNDDDREVIVVDDCSEDDSLDIIRKFPCRLVQLAKHAGASAARNAGSINSKGDILFFIDADCLLQQDTLPVIRKHLANWPADMLIGGTYTPVPYDPEFFSLFQSVFINYSETKSRGNPDYLTTHALVVRAETFKKLGGFKEKFLPILEDVEFCHRIRRAGFRLTMDADLRVQHIFNFSLLRSLRNAVRKTHYWIVYSLENRDLFADSGTASLELKINGIVWLGTVLLGLLTLATGRKGFLMPLPLLGAVDFFVNRHLFNAFSKAGGALFGFLGGMYYMAVYPAAIWIGTFRGVVQYLTHNIRQQDQDDLRRSTSARSVKEP